MEIMKNILKIIDRVASPQVKTEFLRQAQIFHSCRAVMEVRETDLKAKLDDQVNAVADVGTRYETAEVQAMSLHADIRDLEVTEAKARKLLDAASKAHPTVNTAKMRARHLAEQGDCSMLRCTH